MNDQKPKSLIYNIFEPFRRFARLEAFAGILIMICCGIALVWANSPWQESYFGIWNKQVTIEFGDFVLSKPFILWINDGLMAIFFFVVGLEVKREMLVGELSSFRNASLPIMAAIGGMIVPLAMFLLLIGDAPGKEGWGIPMATDIAFALGVLLLLGKRVPLALKVFLTAFAIVDDIGAVLVVAVFYTSKIYWAALFIGLGLIAVLFVMNVFNFRKMTVYLIIGIVVWYFFLKSGIHPTIAGVLIAFTIPVNTKVHNHTFAKRLQGFMLKFSDKKDDSSRILSHDQLSTLDELEGAVQDVISPLQSIEHRMHSLVAYFVLPLFALANGGVLVGEADRFFSNPLALSIAISLIAGKLIGILVFSWLGVKLNITSLPEGSNWKQISGLALLGGIGFTMSIFISNLAFADADMVNSAKFGVIAGSIIAGIAGFVTLKASLKK